MAAKLFNGAEYLITEASKDEVFTPEEFTAEQRQIGETIDQFVRNEINPCREEIEQQNFDVIRELLVKTGDLGLLMIDVPVEYGGLELDEVTSVHATEKLAPTGSFLITWGANSGLGTLPLVYYGTREQKERYLSKLATGALIGAYCLTEPDSGSDALGAKTTATLSEDGKHYILNGTKQFISNGGIADLFTVFAKVDRQHFTAFLVERSSVGLSTGAEEKKLGIKGSSTTQVVFENVNVPTGNVLGEIGKGHKIAFNILNIGRMKTAAGAVGAAKSALAEGVGYSNIRKQFGVPISSFGAIKEKIADMTAAIFASESLLYRLAGQVDARLATIPKETQNYYGVYQRGIEEYALECSVAKVFCTEMLAHVADEVLQIHGGYGFIQEYPAERFYRDERINRIFEGTNEINRILVTTLALSRSKSGDIDWSREVAKAIEELTGPGSGAVGTEPFDVEKTLITNMKRVFLVLLDVAATKCKEAIKNEQEILMALADVAINAFALESTVLRADKIFPSLSETKRRAIEAAVKVFAFNSAAQSGCAVRKAVNYIEEGDNLSTLRTGIARVVSYDVPGLLQAKRQLADAAIEIEKYLF